MNRGNMEKYLKEIAEEYERKEEEERSIFEKKQATEKESEAKIQDINSQALIPCALKPCNGYRYFYHQQSKQFLKQSVFGGFFQRVAQEEVDKLRAIGLVEPTTNLVPPNSSVTPIGPYSVAKDQNVEHDSKATEAAATNPKEKRLIRLRYNVPGDVSFYKNPETDEFFRFDPKVGTYELLTKEWVVSMDLNKCLVFTSDRDKTIPETTSCAAPVEEAVDADLKSWHIIIKPVTYHTDSAELQANSGISIMEQLKEKVAKDELIRLNTDNLHSMVYYYQPFTKKFFKDNLISKTFSCLTTKEAEELKLQKYVPKNSQWYTIGLEGFALQCWKRRYPDITPFSLQRFGPKVRKIEDRGPLTWIQFLRNYTKSFWWHSGTKKVYTFPVDLLGLPEIGDISCIDLWRDYNWETISDKACSDEGLEIPKSIRFALRQSDDWIFERAQVYADEHGFTQINVAGFAAQNWLGTMKDETYKKMVRIPREVDEKDLVEFTPDDFLRYHDQSFWWNPTCKRVYQFPVFLLGVPAMENGEDLKSHKNYWQVLSGYHVKQLGLKVPA